MTSTNPFKMPTDQEVFRLRDEEKRQKSLERENLKYKRVHEKTTWSARIGSANMKTSLGDSDMGGAGFGNNTRDSRGGAGGDPSQLEVHLPSVDIRENDNMALYISKKRDMGLLRMSLATKKQEIKKLDEEAERAENRIRQQEEQLSETKDKFEAFLKHSEMEQVEAMRTADAESKAKLEKMADIKKLNTQIAAIETDRKKNEELLQTCLEFKSFLDVLTPGLFFKQTLYDALCQKERARLTADFEVEFELPEGATEAEEKQLEQERQVRLVQLEQQYQERCQAIDERLTPLMETPEGVKQLQAEIDQLDPEPDAMYFTKPDQILKKFVEIEETNLFLITNCQELEGEIEAVAQTYQKEQQEMVKNAEARTAQMEAVRQKIAIEQARLRQIEERQLRAEGDANAGQEQQAAATKGSIKQSDALKNQEKKKPKTQSEVKEEIEGRIADIFSKIPGHGESNDTLTMLTHIEMKLEEMRLYVKNPANGVEPEFIREVIKNLDKARRQKMRQESQNLIRKKRDERSLLALQRSQAPVVKRVGKPVMWRSRPPDLKKQDTATNEVTTTNEDDEFFT